MPVSTSTVAALQSTSDSNGLLELLTLEGDSLSAPIYIVNDTRSWTIGGITYTAFPFRIKLPGQAQKENPRATLVLDNVGRELTDELEALSPGDTLVATCRLVNRATPTVVDAEFVSALSGISVTTALVTASMGPDDVMRQSAIRVRFDPVTAPGVFPG